MLKTVTATFASRTAVTNAVDDLINADIPRENVFSEDNSTQLKVRVPEVGVVGVKEILARHDPTSVS